MSVEQGQLIGKWLDVTHAPPDVLAAQERVVTSLSEALAREESLRADLTAANENEANALRANVSLTIRLGELVAETKGTPAHDRFLVRRETASLKEWIEQLQTLVAALRADLAEANFLHAQTLVELRTLRADRDAQAETLRGVGALVATSACLKRPALKTEPWDGPCGKCAPCMARSAYYDADGKPKHSLAVPSVVSGPPQEKATGPSLDELLDCYGSGVASSPAPLGGASMEEADG